MDSIQITGVAEEQDNDASEELEDGALHGELSKGPVTATVVNVKDNPYDRESREVRAV